MSQRNEFLGIIFGILLLFGMHIIAIIAIYFVGYILLNINHGYTSLGIWGLAALGFFLWQLFYVIPVSILLKRRQQTGMMKGVIIGAVITALLNGICYLSLTHH